MARPKKFDYDSDDFYDEILALSMQGLTDAEIADEMFSCMKNGNYEAWSDEENERRSARLSKVLARGRRKINSIVRGAYLKAALGGKKIKNKTVTTRKLKIDGVYTEDEEIQTTEGETELPPNMQALSTWLYHHDEEWRKVEKKQEDDEDVSSNGSIDIEKWINDNTND